MSKFKDRIKKSLPSYNFLIGMGSILNLSGEGSKSYDEIMAVSNNDALRRDWAMIGGDFNTVLNQYPINRLKL